jgi:hypothetical protein
MKTHAIWLVRFIGALIMFGSGLAMLGMVLFKFNGVVAALSVLWLVGGAFSFPRMPNAWRRDRPSEKQLAYAMKLGIDVPDDVSKGELSEMITSVAGR